MNDGGQIARTEGSAVTGEVDSTVQDTPNHTRYYYHGAKDAQCPESVSRAAYMNSVI